MKTRKELFREVIEELLPKVERLDLGNAIEKISRKYGEELPPDVKPAPGALAKGLSMGDLDIISEIFWDLVVERKLTPYHNGPHPTVTFLPCK